MEGPDGTVGLEERRERAWIRVKVKVKMKGWGRRRQRLEERAPRERTQRDLLLLKVRVVRAEHPAPPGEGVREKRRA